MSFEYDKLSLTSQREHINSDGKTGIDTSRPKQNGSTDNQFPTTSYSPLPYITCHYRQPNLNSDQQGPDTPRNNKKPHLSSPNTPVSDTLGVRESVLRDGSRLDRESPLSLKTYSSPSTGHLENPSQTNSSSPGDTHNMSHNNYRNATSNNCGEGINFKLYLLFLIYLFI